MLVATAGQTQAALMVSGLSYTSNSVTFTVDGDMTGYTPPPSFYVDQFSIQYSGDVYVGPSNFQANSWSMPVFDNRTFGNPGFTGINGGQAYSWSRYSSTLVGATATNRTITLTLPRADLDPNATNPIFTFVWGNGTPRTNPTPIATISSNAPVPEPSTLAIFALGGIGIVAGGIRRRRKQNA